MLLSQSKKHTASPVLVLVWFQIWCVSAGLASVGKVVLLGENLCVCFSFHQGGEFFKYSGKTL